MAIKNMAEALEVVLILAPLPTEGKAKLVTCI